jgi:tetratricopeptide (TPR) repeat protein
MKRHRFTYFFGTILLAAIMTVIVTAEISQASQDWKGRMHGMASSITCLLPFVASDKAFVDPKNKVKIDGCIDDLWKQTRNLNDVLQKHNGLKPDLYQADPLLPIIADSFAQDIDMVKSLSDRANQKFAQHLLKTTLTYCTACHTRKEESSSTRSFPVFGKVTDSLPLVDRMRYLSAIRNFKSALQEFRNVLGKNPKEQLSDSQFEQATGLALLIALNVENNDEIAMNLIDDVLKSKRGSAAFKLDLIQSKSTLNTVFKKVPPEASASAKLDAAKTLLKTATAATNGQRVNTPGIYYMRASSLLHAALEGQLEPAKKSEAYYNLGVCYDHLEPIGFWSMSEVYFEACLRKSPHTEIAQQCYSAYKDEISIGYSGAAGSPLPSNIQSNLKELEALSKVH